MTYTFTQTRRVEFAETDMAGILHFGAFFVYMETTEHAFYRSLGFSVVAPEAHHGLGWPRVHASCDYRRPLKFEDEVAVQLIVRKKGERSITYEFVFRKAGEDEEVARGRLSVVCVAGDPAGDMRAVPIPEDIAAKIEEAPEAFLAP